MLWITSSWTILVSRKRSSDINICIGPIIPAERTSLHVRSLCSISSARIEMNLCLVVIWRDGANLGVKMSLPDSPLSILSPPNGSCIPRRCCLCALATQLYDPVSMCFWYCRVCLRCSIKTEERGGMWTSQEVERDRSELDQLDLRRCKRPLASHQPILF
jgi:hypothetical protein